MSEFNDLNQAFVMTLVDTTGIQRYIFQSNTLKHIAGASGLVHCVTHDWLEEALGLLGASNLGADGSGKFIEKDNLVSEVVYQGGGNALILFQNIAAAKKFARKLSLRVLNDAPGLALVIVHTELPADAFQRDSAEVAGALRQLFQKANRKKMERRWSSPLPGLGVTAACPYTQKPAVRELNGEWVSAEIFQKEKVGNPFAWDLFNNKFESALNSSGKKYQFVREFNQFSGEEKGSYMAVAHLDGTGMGNRLLDYVETHSGSSARETYNDLKAFSESINKAVQQAMDAAITRLCEKVTNGVVKDANGFLPLRPIVCDGDDITFVCEGGVGLSMAVIIMKYLSKINLPDGKGPIAARAGVAVVKSHFPFSQAYQLAERLNQSARVYAMDLMNAKELNAPPMVVDWHIATSGTIGNLASIREAYQQGNIDLLMRPVTVGYADGWRRWEVLEDLIVAFKSDQWEKNRSKLREMEDVFFEGSEGLHKYLRFQVLPDLPITPEIQAYGGANGFVGDTVVHYDALDVIDFYKFSTLEKEEMQ